MQVEARPAQLMHLFAAETAAAKGMAQGLCAMRLARAGVSPRHAVKLMRGVLNFPEQLAFARLIVHGDLDRPDEGFDAKLWLEPRVGSWLQSLVQALEPTARDVPAIGEEPDGNRQP